MINERINKTTQSSKAQKKTWWNLVAKNPLSEYLPYYNKVNVFGSNFHIKAPTQSAISVGVISSTFNVLNAKKISHLKAIKFVNKPTEDKNDKTRWNKVDLKPAGFRLISPTRPPARKFFFSNYSPICIVFGIDLVCIISGPEQVPFFCYNALLSFCARSLYVFVGRVWPRQ